MAPRSQTLPQAATESAREARRSFFCELCQKGYTRMNDFEAHEGSYDHQHRKRLKEMRQLTKDPNAAAKARSAELKANEEAGIKSINLSSLSGGATTTAASAGPAKKKPVFKSTLQPHNAAVLGVPAAGETLPAVVGGRELGTREVVEDPAQARANGWWDDRYQPHIITAWEGCDEGCEVCGGREMVLEV